MFPASWLSSTTKSIAPRRPAPRPRGRWLDELRVPEAGERFLERTSNFGGRANHLVAIRASIDVDLLLELRVFRQLGFALTVLRVGEPSQVRHRFTGAAAPDPRNVSDGLRTIPVARMQRCVLWPATVAAVFDRLRRVQCWVVRQDAVVAFPAFHSHDDDRRASVVVIGPPRMGRGALVARAHCRHSRLACASVLSLEPSQR
jgi:hypothetical protein